VILHRFLCEKPDITTNKGAALNVDVESVSEENIQKSKDFIWDFMDERNKSLAIYHYQQSLLDVNELPVKKINIGYQYH
jgi:hypothetical protein